MIKNSIFIVLLLCIYAICTTVNAQAPCVFNTPLPINPDYYWTSLSSFRQCLPNIPTDKDLIENTLDIAVSTSNGYSYEYLVQNSSFSGSSYSISVNLKSRIQQIRNKNYDYDYLFHKDLMSLFFSLYDAHTIYMPPNPYKNSYLVFPFELTSSLTSAGQIISVKNDNRLYNAITNSKGTGAAGKTIRTINGMKPKDFLDGIAKTIFMSKEAASRFNEVIKMQEMSLGALIMPDFDTLSYVFSDGSKLDLPLVVLLSQQINGPRDFKSLMAAQPSKLKVGVRINNQKRAPTMAIDPRMIIPELNIPKIVYKKNRFEAKLRGMGGNLKVVYTASDKSVSYLYHTTRRISVFKIESFAPNSQFSQNPWDEFKSVIEKGVAHAQSVGVKSVVLDLQGNGGGYVCLNNALLNLFIKEYSDLSKLYQPFEFKKNPLVDSARNFFIQPYQMLNASNLQPLPNSNFYEKGVTKNLGGVIASYSQQFYLDCASEGNFFFKPATHYFNKIIILTDGLCGSSCSQFASKLVFNNKALAAYVGGYENVLGDISSFNGGAVLHYDDLVNQGAPIPRLTKSNAVFTFNEFHMYTNAQQPIPREFHRIKGDIKINSWDFDDLEGLVDTVAPQFDKMTPLNQ